MLRSILNCEQKQLDCLCFRWTAPYFGWPERWRRQTATLMGSWLMGRSSIIAIASFVRSEAVPFAMEQCYALRQARYNRQDRRSVNFKIVVASGHFVSSLPTFQNNAWNTFSDRQDRRFFVLWVAARCFWHRRLVFKMGYNEIIKTKRVIQELPPVPIF